MRHNKTYIVLLDRARIPGELRIPAFDHVWVEHPDTLPGECVDHLWRASIAVTDSAPVRRADLDGCLKLRAIVVTGPAVIDADACAERGIAVRHLRLADLPEAARGDALMDLIEDLARATAV